jgi:uncharacterized membrane protein
MIPIWVAVGYMIALLIIILIVALIIVTIDEGDVQSVLIILLVFEHIVLIVSVIEHIGGK